MEFRNEHIGSAHLHQWFGGRWVEVIGPPSLMSDDRRTEAE
jgi:hypothetical protein